MGGLLQDALFAMLAATVLLSIGGLILHLEAPEWARRVDLAAIIATVLTAASTFMYAWTRPFWQKEPAGPELAGEGLLLFLTLLVLSTFLVLSATAFTVSFLRDKHRRQQPRHPEAAG